MKSYSSLSYETQDEKLHLEGMDQKRRGGREILSSMLDRNSRCSQDNGIKTFQRHIAVKHYCLLFNSHDFYCGLEQDI